MTLAKREHGAKEKSIIEKDLFINGYAETSPFVKPSLFEK